MATDFGEHGAVVEFEHRKALQRIAGGHFFALWPNAAMSTAPEAPRFPSRPERCSPVAGSARARHRKNFMPPMPSFYANLARTISQGEKFPEPGVNACRR